jgi:hypothetical protein
LSKILVSKAAIAKLVKSVKTVASQGSVIYQLRKVAKASAEYFQRCRQ